MREFSSGCFMSSVKEGICSLTGSREGRDARSLRRKMWDAISTGGAREQTSR